MYSTVVLNGNFEYLNTIHWKKAIKLLIKGKASVLKYTNVVVRAGSAVIKIPAVMKLMKIIRTIYRTHVPFSKKNVMTRDGFTCQYCGSTEDLSIDHVRPIAKGGKSIFENCVTACKFCNNKKGDKLPTESQMFLKKQPTAPTISEFTRIKAKKVGILSMLEELGVY